LYEFLICDLFETRKQNGEILQSRTVLKWMKGVFSPLVVDQAERIFIKHRE